MLHRVYGIEFFKGFSFTVCFGTVSRDGVFLVEGVTSGDTYYYFFFVLLTGNSYVTLLDFLSSVKEEY